MAKIVKDEYIVLTITNRQNKSDSSSSPISTTGEEDAKMFEMTITSVYR